MKVRILAIGQKMPAWVYAGCEEYSKRFPRDFQLELIELPMAKRGKNSSPVECMRLEAKTLQQAFKASDHIVVLDVIARGMDTPALAKRIENAQMQGHQLAIVIGGPDGIDPEIKQMAAEKWSLSDLTLPHPLVRILLLEQLYRAWTIIQGHPYHK